MTPFVKKGSRIRAEWMRAKTDPPASLAGQQLKFQVDQYEVQGIVRHVRGDDPVNPTTIRLYVDPEHAWNGPTTRPPGCTCEKEHVEVNPDHVVAVGE